MPVTYTYTVAKALMCSSSSCSDGIVSEPWA